MRVHAVAILMAFCGCAQAAEWEGVFEGAIGNAKVLVELNAGEEKSDYKGGYSDGARYSYHAKPRDITLILDSEAETLAFTETLLKPFAYTDADDRMITGRWSLKVDKGSATGTWTSPKGKNLPITLSRMALRPRPNADTNDLSHTYEQAWGRTLSFADAGSAKTFGVIEVRWVKDSVFGIIFPTLGRFPDESRKSKANALLIEEHRASLLQYRACINGASGSWEPDPAEPDFSNTIDFASSTVLSFTESGSVFCGGAHPINYVEPISFDLAAPARMGGRYQLDLSPDGFGRVLKLANKDERTAFERFALGRWKEAAEKDLDNAECSTGWIEESPEGEREFSLSFSEKGLAVTRTDWPHVASVCMFAEFNPTIIPYAELGPWLKPGQKLLPKEQE